MKLPLIEALHAKVYGPAPNPTTGMLSVSVGVGPDPSSAWSEDPYLHYRVEATVGLVRIAPEGEIEAVQAEAASAIAHEIYGPVADELRIVQRELWELGLPRSAVGMERLNALIDELRAAEKVKYP
ncbi:MAG: hypothetical protein AAGI03_09120 [Pseudomonadota bacterium]